MSGKEEQGLLRYLSNTPFGAFVAASAGILLTFWGLRWASESFSRHTTGSMMSATTAAGSRNGSCESEMEVLRYFSNTPFGALVGASAGISLSSAGLRATRENSFEGAAATTSERVTHSKSFAAGNMIDGFRGKVGSRLIGKLASWPV